MVFVLDQVLLGRLRGDLMFARNALFAATKLGALFGASLWLADLSGLHVYAAWLIGNAVSVLVVVPLVVPRNGAWSVYRPRRDLRGAWGGRPWGTMPLTWPCRCPCWLCRCW